MSIEPNRLDYLYQQCLQDALTPEERSEWQAFLDEESVEDALKALMDKDYDAMKDEILVEVNENRNAEIVNHIISHPRTIRRTLWLSPYFKTGIAAAIALIVLGVWFFSRNSASGVLNQVQDDVAVNDIAPGKQGATLTLANGKTIRLTDAANGELAKEAGIVITKSADGQLVYNVSNLSPSGREGEAREGSRSSNPLSPQGGSLPEGERSVMNTLSTARGETYKVILPDGSAVWLNAASTLKYPASFAKLKERRVQLSGEAYFEIAKVYSKSSTLSARRASLPEGERSVRVPFIVESDGQQVEVLGTHFNINNYPNSKDIKTTLLEGSVRVAFLSPSGGDGVARGGSKKSNSPLSPQGGSLPRGERNSIILKPNQQSTIKNNQISVATVDTDDVIAWKNGFFVFEEETLENVMDKVGRWYDLDIEYENPNLRNEIFGGSVSRTENVSQVLRILTKAGTVKFKLTGRKIIVSK